jgi:transcriptional regulator with XRE-family HTH domain
MDEFRNNLGKLLKQKRQSANLTLYELSNASGVSTSHLGRIEKGDRFPSAAVLQKIARPLGFGEGELFILAGYLSPSVPLEAEIKTSAPKNELDPYVAKVLSQEPVEVQRAIVGILTILKSIAGNLPAPKNIEVENKPRPL